MKTDPEALMRVQRCLAIIVSHKCDWSFCGADIPTHIRSALDNGRLYNKILWDEEQD